MKYFNILFILIFSILVAIKYSDEIKDFATNRLKDNTLPSLGEQIRKSRKTKNISPETFASSIGLSLSQLKNIENDKATPTRDLITEMEEKLETELVLY